LENEETQSNVNNQPALSLELSLKDIRKVKGDKNPHKDKYQIIRKIENGGNIVVQQWIKGKKDIKTIESINQKKLNNFDGDRFNVKHAGSYTVYIKDESEEKTIETITIKRNKVIVLLIPILIIAGTMGYFILSNILGLPPSNNTGRKLNSNGSAISGIYTGETQSEILADLKKNEVMITDNVASSINFSSGKKGSTGSWVVENIKTNKVIMQAGIYLNGKKIAESAAIKPGQYIKTITLSSDVPAGTYTVTAYINYYNTSTEEYISKAGYKVNLVVKN
jgi:hypothetical protein